MCLQRTWTNWMKSMIESNIQCVILYIYIYIFYIHVFTHLEISSSYMVHTHKHTLIYDFKIRAWLQYRYPYHSSSSWLINFCGKHTQKSIKKRKRKRSSTLPAGLLMWHPLHLQIQKGVCPKHGDNDNPYLQNWVVDENRREIFLCILQLNLPQLLLWNNNGRYWRHLHNLLYATTTLI